MSYAVYEDMRLRFGEARLSQLTSRVTSGPSETRPARTGPDLEVIAAALEDASQLVDSYAAARYRLPLHPVPAPVRRWCADIAYYYLHAAGKISDETRKAYEDAMTGLKDMSRGVILFEAEGVALENARANGIRLEGPERILTPNSLEGF